MASLGQAQIDLHMHPLNVFANNDCEFLPGQQWDYLPEDPGWTGGYTVNGVTFLSLDHPGVEDYSEGPSFIVEAGMNVKVFTRQDYREARVLKGSTTWNQCQRL